MKAEKNISISNSASKPLVITIMIAGNLAVISLLALVYILF